ncbi:voltage-gated chloride channel family protein [Acetobacteraceae bacterium ESL0709]|nr:voltage-gated chloride channel family protein [Acetobacteraceae bacterium ESL0697]MDF7678332.1 voltage-gated chloride channel family protein [Acetobacteraceae bacterium ESL0709]
MSSLKFRFSVLHLRDIGFKNLALWVCALICLSALVGSFCALFLWCLEEVTHLRLVYPFLLYCLPATGAVIGLLYAKWGGASERGNNLLLEEIHKPDKGVPLRMAPLVFIGTVSSHLCGASVGREGTALQIGGAIASSLARLFRLTPELQRLYLIAGLAAGFGAVFGTPIAGAVFALEVLAIGRLDYSALFPSLLASIMADWVCQKWGIHHTVYHVMFDDMGLHTGGYYAVNAALMVKICLASIVFGLISRFFAESVHRLTPVLKRLFPSFWLRPFMGGVATILLVWLLGTRDYLGLGIIPPEPAGASLVTFFSTHHYDWAWALKMLFTVLALASGFKGGEVTPLFFIGAALGNALAPLLGVPPELLAAVGFISVFAAAANTPLACTFMGVELFGSAGLIYYALGCWLAYLCSGHKGIYTAQKIMTPKALLCRHSGGAFPK